jgi:hypothetical protein
MGFHVLSGHPAALSLPIKLLAWGLLARRPGLDEQAADALAGLARPVHRANPKGDDHPAQGCTSSSEPAGTFHILRLRSRTTALTRRALRCAIEGARALRADVKSRTARQMRTAYPPAAGANRRPRRGMRKGFEPILMEYQARSDLITAHPSGGSGVLDISNRYQQNYGLT